jgi:hypothetical protein
MRMSKRAFLFAGILSVATPALAGGPFDIHGLVVGDEGVRYLKGVPTIDLQQQRGAVQLRSLGFYNNRPMYAIAFYNGGPEPVNIGLEDIHASKDGEPLRVFSVQELERQAKQKAWWTQFGLALVGGLGAAAAASQRDHYRASITGPYGTYSVHADYPSLAGQLQASSISMNTAYSIAAVQYQLDQTIELINNHVVQRTTVDPGATYGGLIILDKLKTGKPPFEIHIDVDWNEERYPFAYVMQRRGQPVPDRYAGMLAANAKPHARPSYAAAPEVASGGAKLQVRHASLKGLEKGAIFLRSGAVKIPAKTASGYCLRVPTDYVSTGTKDFPVISRGMPLCESDAD